MSARPFKLTPPVVPEQALHETAASAFHRLIAPPAQWAFYPAGAIQLTEAQIAKLVRMGLKRSWPDFLILHDWLYGIELKKRGAQLSKTRIVRTLRGSPRILIGQADNFPLLIAAGMRDIAVCYSVEEAFAALVRWRIPLRGRIAA
jgi:hypothetical protein